ncbi:Up in starvation [Didymella sp. IMI 355093]|nr:Up in starvation [Didymella sp. IMI 355093]
MSSFQAVNTTLSVPEPPPGRSGEETTPTTPRPDARFQKDAKSGEEVKTEDPSLKTPTRNSFIGIAGQRPLPSSPFEPTRELSETPSTKSNLSRGQSHTSTQSVDPSEDVHMGEGDEDDDKDSDNESVISEMNIWRGTFVSTLVNGRSNAIALAASHASTIFDNTPRPSM